jgi:hypothetical protein
LSKLAKQEDPDHEETGYQGPGPSSAFAPSAEIGQRVHGLLDIGLSIEDVAVATRVKPGTVRKWAAGTAHPRREAEQGIDDLRQIVVILDEAGLSTTKISQWLRSRNRGALKNERPLDTIQTDPLAVLAAAEEALIERDLREDQKRSLKLVNPSEE